MPVSVYSVESFEFAPTLPTGLLPTTGWEKISPIADDAVTMTVPAIATNDIRAQDIPGVYKVLPGDTDPVTVEVATLDINGELAVKLIGGKWDAATKTYSAPALETIKKAAIKVTSKPLDGTKVAFFVVKASILSNITVTMVRNDLVRLSFTARSETPLNANNEPQSPWGWQVIGTIPAG